MSVAIAPPPSQPQHLTALHRANEVRLARADLKRRINAGEVTASDVILADPWQAQTMSLIELLTAQRQWGTQRAARFLGDFMIPETKRCGTLTARQRRVLAGLLKSR